MEDRENRPFSCETCNLRFTTKQFLQRHYMVHTDERQYKCSICENCYKYKKGLNRHYKKLHLQHYRQEIGQKYPPKPQNISNSQFKISKIQHKKQSQDDFLENLCNLSAFEPPQYQKVLDESKIFTASPFPTVN